MKFKGHVLKLISDKCESIGKRYICDCGAVCDRGGVLDGKIVNWNGPFALRPCPLQEQSK